MAVFSGIIKCNLKRVRESCPCSDGSTAHDRCQQVSIVMVMRRWEASWALHSLCCARQGTVLEDFYVLLSSGYTPESIPSVSSSTCIAYRIMYHFVYSIAYIFVYHKACPVLRLSYAYHIVYRIVPSMYHAVSWWMMVYHPCCLYLGF